jgi:hypothetical protein
VHPPILPKESLTISILCEVSPNLYMAALIRWRRGHGPLILQLPTEPSVPLHTLIKPPHGGLKGEAIRISLWSDESPVQGVFQRGPTRARARHEPHTRTGIAQKSDGFQDGIGIWLTFQKEIFLHWEDHCKAATETQLLDSNGTGVQEARLLGPKRDKLHTHFFDLLANRMIRLLRS